MKVIRITMTRLHLLSATLAFILTATASAADVSNAFIARLVAVESGGRADAIGDGGKAIGILQIHPGVVADVNRISVRKFTLADRLDPEKSVEICRIYLGHYATAARLGRPVTDADRARIWNGGPQGHTKAATLAYAARVMK